MITINILKVIILIHYSLLLYALDVEEIILSLSLRN